MKKKNDFQIGDMVEHLYYGLCKVYSMEKKYDIIRIEIEFAQIISGNLIKEYRLVPAETLKHYKIK